MVEQGGDREASSAPTTDYADAPHPQSRVGAGHAVSRALQACWRALLRLAPWSATPAHADAYMSVAQGLVARTMTQQGCPRRSEFLRGSIKHRQGRA